MIVKPTENQKDIRKIIFHPDIYPVISEGVTIDPQTHFPTDDVLYIGGYVEDEIIALACVHNFRDGLKWHAQVLPLARYLYAREFLRESLDMVKYTKIYAEIPLHRKRLYNLAKKLGFHTIEIGKKRVMSL